MINSSAFFQAARAVPAEGLYLQHSLVCCWVGQAALQKEFLWSGNIERERFPLMVES